MKEKSSSKPLSNLSREELNAQLEALRQPSQIVRITVVRFSEVFSGNLLELGQFWA